MKASVFRVDQANFIARAAMDRRRVTYGEFAKEFGLANQGCGEPLSHMGMRLKKNSLTGPPVIVVSRLTDLPSAGADFYKRVGLDKDDLAIEQERCFNHDWTAEPFWKDKT